MPRKKIARFKFCLGLLLTAGMSLPPVAQACSRLVYFGGDDQVVTARSMDWASDIQTNLWVFPRGMARNGEVGPNSIRWTSRYGSVIAAAYDNSTSDGMNEAGLVANILWLAESQYPDNSGSKPGLSIAAWAQYVLDNFTTVQAAVDALAKEPFIIVTAQVPGQDRVANLHLALSDPSGDSAIIEYVNGRQLIHHSRDYQVMTNSPTFGRQLAMEEYWQQIGGTVFLPGTNRAADRFARASFYVRSIPPVSDPLQTIATAFSIIRNVSVPIGISTPNQPNISATRWRTVSDQKRRRTGKVLKLDLGPNERNIFSGMANKDFKPAKPFQFAGLP
ncbi:linear amide C-N hydrolase [Sphingomonas sp.]|uniref:linear amide C-N hydrolase n=1 Tax=Sphingomonas sp. TaxID=28214 RepID=UPI00261377D3|nr:linear amide C-N hydrolase [Sphingomonas sp.]MDF2493214.1 choloylglycine hydrolase [Sphingomonas sp.]